MTDAYNVKMTDANNGDMLVLMDFRSGYVEADPEEIDAAIVRVFEREAHAIKDNEELRIAVPGEVDFATLSAFPAFDVFAAKTVAGYEGTPAQRRDAFAKWEAGAHVLLRKKLFHIPPSQKGGLRVYVLDEDGEIVGMTTSSFRKTFLRVNYVQVLEEAYGRGLCTAMFTRLMEYVRDKTEIRLVTLMNVGGPAGCLCYLRGAVNAGWSPQTGAKKDFDVKNCPTLPSVIKRFIR